MRQVALFYLFSRVYIAYIYNKGVPNFGTPFELVEYLIMPPQLQPEQQPNVR